MSRHSTLTDPAIHPCKGSSTATAGQIATADGAGGSSFQDPATPTGLPFRSEVTTSVSASTGTTVIPLDDTIPQNTEGDQYMTASFTPVGIGNKVRVKVLVTGAVSNTNTVVAALFQDTTANALSAGADYNPLANQLSQVSLVYEYTVASLTATTFEVRVGPAAAGTFTFNGASGARLLGGVLTSFIEVSEIKA